MEEKNIGQVPQNQIDLWKKQFTEVYEIQVDNHVCYVRGFDRATMKYALSRLSIKIRERQENEISLEKVIEIGEIALQNCWLGGSDEIKTNDRLFIGASMQIGELFDVAETKLKKL